MTDGLARALSRTDDPVVERTLDGATALGFLRAAANK